MFDRKGMNLFEFVIGGSTCLQKCNALFENKGFWVFRDDLCTVEKQRNGFKWYTI